MYRCVVAHVKYLGVFLMVMRDFILAVNEYFSSVFYQLYFLFSVQLPIQRTWMYSSKGIRNQALALESLGARDQISQ